MRTNDGTLAIFTFLLGSLLGVIATVSIYGPISNRLSEGERQEAEQALKKAQEERDEAQAKIDAYLEGEKHPQLDMEQPGGGEPPARAAEVAAAEPAVETLPPPQEEPSEAAKSAAALGFGPPRQYGKN